VTSKYKISFYIFAPLYIAQASFERYQEAVQSYYAQAASGQDRIEPAAGL
jgi:hypothetical protein